MPVLYVRRPLLQGTAGDAASVRTMNSHKVMLPNLNLRKVMVPGDRDGEARGPSLGAETLSPRKVMVPTGRGARPHSSADESAATGKGWRPHPPEAAGSASLGGHRDKLGG